MAKQRTILKQETEAGKQIRIVHVWPDEGRDHFDLYVGDSMIRSYVCAENGFSPKYNALAHAKWFVSGCPA